MEESLNRVAEDAAAFQKLWIETMSRLTEAALALSPNSSAPDLIRQARAAIFEALATSWDEFMRSPKFLEAVRQWMENAITYRKLSNDFMARVRTELQAPSRGDIDSVMLTVRHMEKRLLDRLDEISAEMNELKNRGNRKNAARSAGRTSPVAARPRRGRTAENGKEAAP